MYLTGIDLTGLDDLLARLTAVEHLVEHPTAMPLMDAMGDLIVEQNRAGVLAGLDKDGEPAPPLRYRNATGRIKRGAGSFRVGKLRAKGYRERPETSERFGTQFPGYGMHPRGVNIGEILPFGNLTTEQYQKLTGPRLAPRGEASRSIASFFKVPPYVEGDELVAEAAWVDVLDANGRPFLMKHFKAASPAMRYDLRGVRPQAMAQARRLFRAWALWVLRGGSGAMPSMEAM
jgi:hypothetical protein